jgi:1-acyl-sn-glycerol-3-phosphate acyltransferase
LLYALVVRLLLPTTWWGRMRVDGAEAVPRHGPLLVVANHDSQWDAVVVAIALRKRRKLRFLARANLWRIFGLAPVLNGLRQIPIERGAGDRRALDNAIEALRAGVSVVLCAVGGTTDYVRFPRRPRVRVRFFEPAAGGPRDAEGAGEITARFLDEIRAVAPPVAAGRRPSPMTTTATASDGAERPTPSGR